MDRAFGEGVRHLRGHRRSDKSGTILYALGQTQHTYGAQNCRSMASCSFCWSSVSVAGGGVNALRSGRACRRHRHGHARGEPARLPELAHRYAPSLRKWCERRRRTRTVTTPTSQKVHRRAEGMVRRRVTVENDYGYDWWPKVPKEPRLPIIGSFELMSEVSSRATPARGIRPCHSDAEREQHAAPWRTLGLARGGRLEWEQSPPSGRPRHEHDISTTVYFLPQR